MCDSTFISEHPTSPLLWKFHNCNNQFSLICLDRTFRRNKMELFEIPEILKKYLLCTSGSSHYELELLHFTSIWAP